LIFPELFRRQYSALRDSIRKLNPLLQSAGTAPVVFIWAALVASSTQAAADAHWLPHLLPHSLVFIWAV
jgi:hypothetical protein